MEDNCRGAPIKLEGLDGYAILTVFSGWKKKFSVMTTFNGKSYIGGVDAFLKGIKLDQSANPAFAQTGIPAVNGMKYTVPGGWNVSQYADGDILTPADLPKGEFLEIWVQPSMIFSGTMEQALQKSYEETVTKLAATTMNESNGSHYTIQTEKKIFQGLGIYPV